MRTHSELFFGCNSGPVNPTGFAATATLAGACASPHPVPCSESRYSFMAPSTVSRFGTYGEPFSRVSRFAPNVLAAEN